MHKQTVLGALNVCTERFLVSETETLSGTLRKLGRRGPPTVYCSTRTAVLWLLWLLEGAWEAWGEVLGGGGGELVGAFRVGRTFFRGFLDFFQEN